VTWGRRIKKKQHNYIWIARAERRKLFRNTGYGGQVAERNNESRNIDYVTTLGRRKG
jgi:hypothetical protein